MTFSVLNSICEICYVLQTEFADYVRKWKLTYVVLKGS